MPGPGLAPARVGQTDGRLAPRGRADCRAEVSGKEEDDRGGRKNRDQIFPDQTSGGQPSGQMVPGRRFRDDQQDGHDDQYDTAGDPAGQVDDLDPVRFFGFGKIRILI